MLETASSPDQSRTAAGPTPVARGLPELRRHPIRHPDDYGIDLPEWLRECIVNVPPGIGQSCPTDPEALLVSAFDFGFQLHEGQFRASGDPYIVHPVAVADLLRDIVLDKGRIVEEGPGERILRDPQAAISRTLVDACPRLP